MKKYSRGMVFFVVMMMFFLVVVQVVDGKVIFNGEVIENICMVVNKDKMVILLMVQCLVFSSVGEMVGVVFFIIDLMSCILGVDVLVYFEKD